MEQIHKQNHNHIPFAMTRPEFADRWRISLRFLDYLIKDEVIRVTDIGPRCVRIPVAPADQALRKPFIFHPLFKWL
jgi:hypothetical protein